MRLYSTPKSFLEREVTLLAIVESFLAGCAVLWIADQGHWLYLAVSVCSTPFLMLRTAASTALGLERFTGWTPDLARNTSGIIREFSAPGTKFPELLFVALLFPLVAVVLPIVALYAKVGATIATVRGDPLTALRAIPGNWMANVFCLDSAHPPELVPGLELWRPSWAEDLAAKRLYYDDEGYSDLRFSRILSSIYEEWDGKRIATSIIAALAKILIYLPAIAAALIYRMSIKGTAMVWIPLVWIIPKLELDERFSIALERINKTSLGRLRMLGSSILLAAFASKLLVYDGAFRLREFTGNLGIIISDYVAPYALPRWQVASAVNAVLALFLYFWASDQILRLKYHANAGTLVQKRILIACRTVAAILSCYTLSCLVYLAIKRAQFFNLPPLGDKWFPWS